MRTLQATPSSVSDDSDQSDDFLQSDDSDQPDPREMMCLVFRDGSVTTVDPQSEQA